MSSCVFLMFIFPASSGGWLLFPCRTAIHAGQERKESKRKQHGRASLYTDRSRRFAPVLRPPLPETAQSPPADCHPAGVRGRTLLLWFLGLCAVFAGIFCATAGGGVTPLPAVGRWPGRQGPAPASKRRPGCPARPAWSAPPPRCPWPPPRP